MWGLILTAVLQIIGFILNKVGANKKTKQAYIEFLRLASNDQKSTVLMKAGQKMLEKLKAKKWPIETMEKDLD